MTTLEIVVTVGSDHHPFDRLIGWVDDWLAAQSPGDVHCVLQFGTARAPAHGIAEAFLPHDELLTLMRAADVVVTQGGPMGIVEARQCGTRPIAVPRLGRLGEVVDDHQVTFCRHLAGLGSLVIAEDAPALTEALDRAVADPATYRVEPNVVEPHVAETIERFDALVAGLRPRRGLWRRRP